MAGVKRGGNEVLGFWGRQVKRQLFSFFFIYSAGGMRPDKIRVAQAEVFIRFLEKKRKKKAFFLSVAIGNLLLVVAGGLQDRGWTG